MGDKFTHIASVDFSHEYYAPLSFDGFSCVWESGSRLKASNLQLLLKAFSGGFSLYSSDPELLSDEESHLFVRIFIKDPLFYNFTDLEGEFRPDSKVLLFRNTGEATGSKRLHSGEFVSIADSLEVLNAKNMEELRSEINADTVSIRDFSGMEISQDKAFQFIMDREERIFFVSEGNQVKGYYKRSDPLEKLPFGLVSFHCGQLYKNYSDFRQATAASVRFQTRSTIWKYILADKVYEKFPQLKIIDSQNKEVNFKESEFEVPPDWKVRSFESEVKLPFTSHSNSGFQLVETPKEGSQAMRIVVKQLPKGNPDGLYRLPANDDGLFTHIFI
ncbi:hypothetical protein [Algoriphagus sp.]|uniref:hypothetical protein n=1 Tax=Algoriphagus sp. TaxID=1872435 RepID=UPI003F6F1B89